LKHQQFDPGAEGHSRIFAEDWIIIAELTFGLFPMIFRMVWDQSGGLLQQSKCLESIMMFTACLP
jgi:hypothetical protein